MKKLFRAVSFGLIGAGVLAASAVIAAEKGHWDVGSPAGGDASRALYVYNGNDGEAPALRIDCQPGQRLKVSHIIKSKGSFNPDITLTIAAGDTSLNLAARSEVDALTEWNLVTYETSPASPFIAMLRADNGRMTISAKGGAPLSIDLDGNRGKVDAALRLCKK